MMEPVIKKNHYHHVLLMRDDREVLSFKVHNRVLQYSILICIVLLILGVSGAIFGAHSWKKHHSLKIQYAKTSAELSDARLQLEKLTNLQSLISASDFPAPAFKFDEIQLQPIIDNSAPAVVPFALENGQSNPPPDKENADTSIAPPSGNGKIGEAQAAEAIFAGPETPQGPVPGSQATEPVPAEQGANHVNGDNSPVRIANFTNKTTARDRIQIAFDLVTSRQDAFVRGGTTYQIVLQDGSTLPITPTFADDTRFAITRMKNFDLTANLPAKVTPQLVKQVIIFVTLDNGDTFTASFPFGS